MCNTYSIWVVSQSTFVPPPPLRRCQCCRLYVGLPVPRSVEQMLSVDIPRLMEMLPRTVAPTRADEQASKGRFFFRINLVLKVWVVWVTRQYNSSGRSRAGSSAFFLRNYCVLLLSLTKLRTIYGFKTHALNSLHAFWYLHPETVYKKKQKIVADTRKNRFFFFEFHAACRKGRARQRGVDPPSPPPPTEMSPRHLHPETLYYICCEPYPFFFFFSFCGGCLYEG